MEELREKLFQKLTDQEKEVAEYAFRVGFSARFYTEKTDSDSTQSMDSTFEEDF